MRKIKWISERRSPRIIGFLALAAGILIGGLWPLSAGAQVGRDVRMPPPGRSREMAQERAPYRLKEPRFVPSDMALWHVSFNGGPEDGERSVSVDHWYRSPNGAKLIHVWQTNNQELAAVGKDPADPALGQPVDIRGHEWRLVYLPDRGLTVLSRRFEDGTTVSVSGNLAEETLREVAGSVSSS
ncbi:MAG: hypothetical protein ABR575_03115 [Actinomycetota bacterium]